jgi:hypothetical protein
MEGHKKAVQILLKKYSVNLTIKNREGLTAEEVAGN